MKIRLGALLFLAVMLALRADSTAQQNYLAVYLERNDADCLEKQKHYLGALARYEVTGSFLKGLRDRYPDWEQSLVEKCINDCRGKQIELERLVDEQMWARSERPITAGPDFSPTVVDPDVSDRGVWWEMNCVQEYLCVLQSVHRVEPEWEKIGIEQRIDGIQKQVDRLEAAALDEDAARRTATARKGTPVVQ